MDGKPCVPHIYCGFDTLDELMDAVDTFADQCRGDDRWDVCREAIEIMNKEFEDG